MTRTLVLIIGPLFAVLLSACFGPDFRECAVQCGQTGRCPSGATCGSDGYCYKGENLDGVVLCGDRPDSSMMSEIADANDQNEIDAGPDDPDADIPMCDCEILQSPDCCGAGNACDGVSANGFEPRCRAATAAGSEETTCTVPSDCASGFNCYDGACRRWCDVHSDCEGGGRCGFETGLALDFCTTTCDPVTNDGCPSGWGCRLIVSSFGYTIAWCTDAGGGGHEQPCSVDEDCLAGHSCIDVENEGKLCLRNCNADTDPSCAAVPNAICMGTGAIFQGDEYGACL